MLRKYAVLVAVCLGTVLSAYLSSCINIALPNIMASLNFDMDSIVWVSLGYTVPYGAIMPLTGKLGDEFWAKHVYVGGLTLFAVASMLCGLATSSTMMIIFRVMQGVGAGMLLPNALTIVTKTFDARERGQAVGIWGAMAAAGGAIGPTVGGYVVEKFDWHMMFFSIGPVCVISILFAIAIIPAIGRASKTAIDYPGVGLLILSIGSLLIALNKGQSEGWNSLYIISLFYTSFSAMVLFIAVESAARQPMIDIRLFRNLNFTVATVVIFFSFLCFMAINFLLPFFLKSLLGYNSITAGIMMLPMSVALMLLSPVGGWLGDRFGPRLPTFCGIMMISLSLYLLNTVSADYSTHNFFIRLTLFGVGLGLIMSPLTNCAMSSVPHDKIGVGSGIFNLFQIIGGSVGVVLSQTLLTRREIYHAAELKEYLNPATPASSEIFHLLCTLYKGMDSSLLSIATHGWMTGQALLPKQYAAFKTVLNGMVSRQAVILSFQDVFYGLALVAFCGGLLTLLLRRKSVQPKMTEP